MALKTEAVEASKLGQAGVLDSADQARLSTALHMASARLTEFKGRVRRAVALVDEFDGHQVPVLVEADVLDGAPFGALQQDLAHTVFGRVYGATQVTMAFSIVDDLASHVSTTSLLSLLV